MFILCIMPVLTRAMLRRRQEKFPSPSNSDGDSSSSSSEETEDEEEEGPLIEPSKNPLLNHLILSKLFECMGVKDLKACRLVSKQWHISTIPVTRSRFHVRIRGHRSDPSIQRVQGIRTIEDFMELIDSNTLGIQLWNFKFLGPIDPTAGVGRKFLSIFGKDMKSLELFVNFGEGGSYAVEDIRRILQSTPNLENFGIPSPLSSKRGNKSVVKLSPPKLPFLKRFYSGMEEPDGRRKCCPTFLEELFTAAENISKVYVYDYDGMVFLTKSLPGNILEVLEVLEKLGRESKLENLTISRVRASHLNILERMASNGLKLKHLRILQGQIPLQDPEPDNIWLQAIKLFAESLITLGVCYGGSTLTELPRMPQLKILDVHIPANGDFRCERINFINTFPALESLSMICKGGPHEPSPSGPLPLHQFFNGNEICQNMKTLSLRDGFDLTTNQALEHALKIFPNLYELELKIESAELLQQIWVHMSGSGLEKLHLYGELGNQTIENIDSLFTGITPQEIVKMGKCKKYFRSFQSKSPEETRQSLQTLVERHRTLPSITNLTSLRLLSLSIPSSGARDCKSVTDLTGYLGLYFLKNLQELRVRCDFSRACKNILIQDIDLDSWHFEQGVFEYPEERVESHREPYDGIRRNKRTEFGYAYSYDF